MIPRRTKNSLKILNNYINYLDSIKPVKDMVIIEIGCWVGVSTELFAKRFKHVIAIDPFEPTEDTISAEYDMEDVYEEYKKRTKPYNNILTIKARNEDVVDHVMQTIKLHNFLTSNKNVVVYIDGDHHYKPVKEDIKRWRNKADIISGHDYYAKFPGVMKAVNEEFGKPIKVFGDTTWIGEIK